MSLDLLTNVTLRVPLLEQKLITTGKHEYIPVLVDFVLLNLFFSVKDLWIILCFFGDYFIAGSTTIYDFISCSTTIYDFIACSTTIYDFIACSTTIYDFQLSLLMSSNFSYLICLNMINLIYVFFYLEKLMLFYFIYSG